jgi:hypothetical protein
MSKKSIIAIILTVVLVTAIGVTAGVLLYKDWPDVIQDFEAKKSEDTLRVMSFNIRCTNVGRDSWEDRIDIVTETMVKSEADSIGVQEATPEWIETLTKEIGDKYEWVGEGRNGGNKGEYSAVFYLKDKYTATESGTFWLSPTPEMPSKG